MVRKLAWSFNMYILPINVPDDKQNRGKLHPIPRTWLEDWSLGGLECLSCL